MGKTSSSKELKGLFFDLDGTLVDTTKPNVIAYQHALKKIGRDISENEILSVFGTRYDVFLKKFFPGISTEEIQNVRIIKANEYPKHLHLAKPNHELINFIRTVRGHHTTVLVTMAQGKSARAVLKSCGIEDLFDLFVTGDQVSNAKPHPECYERALELSQLKPQEVVAFEDSDIGIESAAQAGIPTIKISIT